MFANYDKIKEVVTRNSSDQNNMLHDMKIIEGVLRDFTCSNCKNDCSSINDFPCNECKYGYRAKGFKKIYFTHRDCT